MLQTLMPGIGALERPQNGEHCRIYVTDDKDGICVSVERQKLVTANPRWEVTSGVDEDEDEVHTYRAFFEFDKEKEADIIVSVQTLLAISE